MSTATNLDNESIEMIVVLIKGYMRNGFNDQDIRFKLRKKFEDAEINAALQICADSDASQSSDANPSLKEPNDYFGWYHGPKESGEYHWPRLKESLLHKDVPWTKEMIKSLDDASTLVVSNMAPPDSTKSVKCKGLVLGYIQSGKTANFSATIAKAIDEGYKLIIVLAGMHNNLRKQTEVRLREELVEPGDGKTCTTLTTDEDTGDFKRRQSVTATRTLVRKDGFTLAVLKKNSSVLRSFRSWLQEASPEILQNCPTLIIDDESDQASINTNKEDQDPTAINNHIRELIKLFRVVSYVGYTATPFANVFVNVEPADDIYPKDFLVALDKPATYYGPEELFGRDAVNGKHSTDGMPVIRSVSDEDALMLRESAKEEGARVTIVPSLANAIDSFVLGGALRLCRGHWKHHITMLVHLTHLTSPQKELKEALEVYIGELKNQAEDNDKSFKARITDLLNKDFNKVTSTIIGPQPIDFDLLWKNLTKFLGRMEIIMDNSNSSERLTFDSSLRDGEPLWGIVVGGNTLSRGLTLEGLTTSFFVRDSKAYDTLLQMGRWFGYRKGYADLTRIFVTNDLYENFYHLATIEQEIRDEIRVMAANNEKPIDVALRIRRHPSMLITANNKMRSGVSATLTFSGTKIQTHQIDVSDKSKILANYKVVEALLSKLQGTGKRVDPIAFKDLESSILFRGIHPETIQQFLDSVNVSDSNAKFHKKMIQGYIEDLVKQSELIDWSVAIMSKKQGIPIKIGNLQVYPMNRSVKHELNRPNGDIEVTLHAISTPGEELIDLQDLINSDFKTTDDILEPKGGPKKSDTRLRQELRPKERGLLMIYPLQSNTEMTDEEYLKSRQEIATSFPLRGAGQIFAFSLVFPKASAPIGQMRYMKNRSV
jgi:hypothetical protein